MMNNLEDIVQLVLGAYYEVHEEDGITTPIFELELRKALMQKYCNITPAPREPKEIPYTYTYTIKPGQGTMGTWTTSNRKQILHG